VTGWTTQERLDIKRLGTCAEGHPRAERHQSTASGKFSEVYCPRCEQAGFPGLASFTHIHEFSAPYFQRGLSGWISVVDPCSCGLVWGEHLRESLRRNEDVRFAGGEVRFVAEASSHATGLTRTDFIRLSYQSALDKTRRARDGWRDGVLMWWALIATMFFVHDEHWSRWWSAGIVLAVGAVGGITQFVVGRREKRKDDDGRFRV
jgi:hypothetical protein